MQRVDIICSSNDAGSIVIANYTVMIIVSVKVKLIFQKRNDNEQRLLMINDPGTLYCMLQAQIM